MTDEIVKAIQYWATLFKLDPDLVAAIVMTESSGIQTQMRYEEDWKYFYFPEKFVTPFNSLETETRLQAFSYGLMQVMGSVARELGLVKPIITMIDINVGIQYGAAQLRRLLTRWPQTRDAIAAYNAGSPITDPVTHLYKNQDYVDKVVGYYNKKLISEREA